MVSPGNPATFTRRAPIFIMSDELLNPKYFNLFRLVAAVLTGVLLLAYPYIPERSQIIFPTPSTTTEPYTDAVLGGTSKATWIDEANGKLECDIQKSDKFQLCGFSIKSVKNLAHKGNTDQTALPKNLNAFDLSKFDRLIINASYQGDSKNVRFYIRNSENPLIKFDDDKFMSALVRPIELGAPISLPITDFTVAEWWASQQDLPRDKLRPRYNNIMSIGLDITYPLSFTKHIVQISRVEARGAVISKESLYLTIILFWIFVITVDAGYRVYQLIRHKKASNKVISSLISDYSSLHSKAQIDALTHLLNRSAVDDYVGALEKKIRDNIFSILVFDIDHFKNINDTYGHAVGDIILQDFANLLTKNTREKDKLGRWGGEEFILICEGIDNTRTMGLANKLRKIVSEHIFECQAHKLQITVSVGIATWNEKETFAQCFARADKALYLSKESGRNQVNFLAFN
jgi:diguanylate cyclase (GGDEF)-like protein